MSQPWEPDLYTASTVADTTLNNMELMFATLRSSFSGASAPGSVVAGQVWYDTAKTLLKHRNNANSAWRGMLAGTSALKLWLYLNAAQEGWALDSTTGADNVLAIKGGAAAYTVNGGNDDVGSWTISGVSTGGTAINISQMPAHTHTEHTWAGAGGDMRRGGTGEGSVVASGSAGSGTNHNHSIASDAGWRPDAAIGRLFYPDV